MAKASVLDILANATEKDLDEVIERRKTLQREADALGVLERALDVKLNGKPERAKPGPRKQATVGGGEPAAAAGRGTAFMEYRRKAAQHILKNGRTKQALLCHAAGIPSGSSTAVFDHEWFQRDPDGIGLTAIGKHANG